MGSVLFAANEGSLIDVPVDKILDFEAALIAYMNSEHAAFMAEINAKGAYTPEVIDTMRKAIETFKSTQTW
jgi:F-type H+-transporting ATPase subunit alpha